MTSFFEQVYRYHVCDNRQRFLVINESGDAVSHNNDSPKLNFMKKMCNWKRDMEAFEVVIFL